MVRVRLFGTPMLDRDGEAVPFPAGRPGALLGWLALHPGMHSRREVAGTFWPEVPEESARSSLRTALYAVRQVLGDGLVATRDQVGLAPDVRVDETGPGGELLEGFDDEWVYAAREQRRARDAAALDELAGAAEAA